MIIQHVVLANPGWVHRHIEDPAIVEPIVAWALVFDERKYAIRPMVVRAGADRAVLAPEGIGRVEIVK